MTPRRLLALTSGLVGAALVLAGCVSTTGAQDLGTSPSTGASATASAGASASASSTPAACADPTQSYAPSDLSIPDGSTMARIKANGSLRVGVSADTYLMGSRNPLTGQIEGFDIDMAHLVAQAIFGDPSKITYVVITAADRIPRLQDGSVDLVARAMTMTCDRWTQIAFSAEYYHAGQKLLVSKDSTATGLADLSGKKVCAPAGTTTLTSLSAYPQVTAVSAATHTACLALFQQRQVDAITGDDTVLAGLAAQDPYAKVVGAAISDEPYGLGIAAADVDLVRFVNAVLAQAESDGAWTAAYDRWLSVLGPAPSPPTPVYGR